MPAPVLKGTQGEQTKIATKRRPNTSEWLDKNFKIYQLIIESDETELPLFYTRIGAD